MRAENLLFVDFARGFSMGTIVLMHTSRYLPMPGFLRTAFEFGGSGVHLFVFLSGFCLLLSRQVSVAEFYKNRFVKVLVPFYVIITVVFIIDSIINFSYYQSSWNAYLGSIFLYRMFDNSILFAMGFEYWFVMMIVQFYLLWPLLLALEKRVSWKTFLVITMSISILWWIVVAKFAYASGVHLNFFLTYIWEFALGMVCARLYKNRDFQFWNSKPAVYATIGVVGLGCMFVMNSKLGRAGTIFNDIPAFFGFTGVCLLLYILAKEHAGWLFKSMGFIGKISYSMYLIHCVLITITMAILNHFGFAAKYLCVFPLLLVSIVVCSFWYQRLIDQFIGYAGKKI